MTASIKQLHQLEQQLDRYFEQHAAASQQLANLLGNECQPQKLVALLEQLINSPTLLKQVASRSYQHGNGFLKVVLLDKGYKLRLHVWHQGKKCEENIHNHRWSFASTVVAGTLRSEIWRNAAPGNPHAVTLPEYRYYAATAEQPAYANPLGHCLLEKEKDQAVSAGESYFMPQGQLHCINNPGKQLVATLVCTSPTGQGTNRLIKTRSQIEPDTNPPRLQTAELRCQLQRFLTLYQEQVCASPVE